MRAATRILAAGILLALATSVQAGSAGGALGTILGRPVTDPQGEAVGQLVDVLVDAAGAPLAGIVDVGGFMGVGTKRVAVGWALLRFVAEAGELHVRVALPLEAVAAAAEFRGVEGAEILLGRASR